MKTFFEGLRDAMLGGLRALRRRKPLVTHEVILPDEDEEDIAAAQEALSETTNTISWEDVKKNLGLNKRDSQ